MTNRSHTPTPWTDAAIDALRSDAFAVHGTIWDELRRIESAHDKLVAALRGFVGQVEALNCQQAFATDYQNARAVLAEVEPNEE